VHHKITSNRLGIRSRHFAFEERDEVKIHVLSPARHLRRGQRPRVGRVAGGGAGGTPRAEQTCAGGARGGRRVGRAVAARWASDGGAYMHEVGGARGEQRRRATEPQETPATVSVNYCRQLAFPFLLVDSIQLPFSLVDSMQFAHLFGGFHASVGFG